MATAPDTTMKIIASYLIPDFDIGSEDKQRIHRILEEINAATEKAVSDVMVTNGIHGDLLSASQAGANDLRVVLANGDKILAVRKHKKLPTTTQQTTLNKFWATLMRSHELHHPEDPNYN